MKKIIIEIFGDYADELDAESVGEMVYNHLIEDYNMDYYNFTVIAYYQEQLDDSREVEMVKDW